MEEVTKDLYDKSKDSKYLGYLGRLKDLNIDLWERINE
jgi:hypothetical protein